MVRWTFVMELEKAFVRDITQHQGIIHRVCRLYAVGVANQEDLFQEIVLQLWRAYPAFRGEAKVSTWMYRIALNTAISGLRQARRQLSVQPLTPTLAAQLPGEPASLPPEENGRLHRAIRCLSEVERAIIMLHLEEHPYEDIAAITGLTPNYVGVKLHRIKAKLRQLLTRSSAHPQLPSS